MEEAEPRTSATESRRRFGDERYFTPGEIAVRLGYRDDGPVREAIREGDLRACQPSKRRTVVAESEIERWLADCEVESKSAHAAASSPSRSPRLSWKRTGELPLLGQVVRA